VKLRGKVVGVVNALVKGDAAGPDIISLFEEVTNRLSFSLENVRLLEESNLRAEQLHLLQAITAEAAAHVDLHHLLQAVARKIFEGYQLDYCSVMQIDRHRQALEIITDFGNLPCGEEPDQTILAEYKEEFFQEAVLLNKAVAYDIEHSSQMLEKIEKFFQVRGLQAVMLLPLKSRGELMGVLLLATTEGSRRFSQDDQRLADQIALQISTAIDVAYLFEQTDLRAQRERLIGEITSQIRMTLNLDTVVQTAAREMRRSLQLDQVEIRLGLDEPPLSGNGGKGAPERQL
jgi:GAF domain-containing protein